MSKRKSKKATRPPADIEDGIAASEGRLKALAARLPGGPSGDYIAVICDFLASQYGWGLDQIAGLDNTQMTILVEQALRREAQAGLPAPPQYTDAATAPPQRLRFDDATLTVTLDGKPIRVDDQKAYAIYKAIVEEYKPGSPVLNEFIQSRVKGLNGKGAISTHFNKLPPALRDTVNRGTNGKSLVLPPTGK